MPEGWPGKESVQDILQDRIRNLVVGIGFLANPKSDRSYDKDKIIELIRTKEKDVKKVYGKMKAEDAQKIKKFFEAISSPPDKPDTEYMEKVNKEFSKIENLA